jgi:hypothetical protein
MRLTVRKQNTSAARSIDLMVVSPSFQSRRPPKAGAATAANPRPKDRFTLPERCGADISRLMPFFPDFPDIRRFAQSGEADGAR